LSVQADVDLFEGNPAAISSAGVKRPQGQAPAQAAQGFQVNLQLPGRVGRFGGQGNCLLIDVDIAASLKSFGLDAPRS